MMENLQVICEKCKKTFKVTEMYLSSTPLPHELMIKDRPTDEKLIATQVTFIPPDEESKIPSYVTTYVFNRKCPSCGHVGKYRYSDLILDKDRLEPLVGALMLANRQLMEENAILRRRLEKEDKRDRRLYG